jgi:hypothetical protein
MWNANIGVVKHAVDRLQADPTPGQFERMFREMARADGRIVAWLGDHRATACQQPFKRRMVNRGIEARKAFKAAARAVERKAWAAAERDLTLGLAYHQAMFNAGYRMVGSC